MPANLPPDYYAAESAFSRRLHTAGQARSARAHAGGHATPQGHRSPACRTADAYGQELSRQHAGAHTDLYAVHREGVGQVALIGPPNSGKSSLLNALTGASARVGDYAFTTQLHQPAMMPFEDIQVQLVDLPAVSPGATPAWMRGLAHGADLLLLVVDLDSDPMADLELVGSELAAWQVGPAAPRRNAGEKETRESRPALVVGTKLDLPAAAEGAELLRLELQERLPAAHVGSVRRWPRRTAQAHRRGDLRARPWEP